MKQVFNKYGKNLSVTSTQKGLQQDKTQRIHFSTLTDLKRKTTMFKHNFKTVSNSFDPFKIKQYHRTKLKTFFECCICASQDRVQMHHIRSLKSAKISSVNNNVQATQRALTKLQVPLCFSCHQDITHGRYNAESPKQLYLDFSNSINSI